MIETHQLNHVFGTTPCLHDLNLHVPEGSVLGFLGPNGAGKTTTIRVLTGLLRPTSGYATIGGFRVDSQLDQVRQMIGFLPEEAPAFGEMRLAAFLRYIAGLKNIPGKKIKSEVERVLELVDLLKDQQRLVGNISKGMRRRLGIAQALLGNPKVLILDEPTDGLDPTQIATTRDLIKSLKGNTTVFFSTHILPNVVQTCSHVAILARGKMLFQGSMEEVEKQNPPKLVWRVQRSNEPRNPLKSFFESKQLNSLQYGESSQYWEAELGGGLPSAQDQNGLLRGMLDSGLLVREVFLQQPSLEDIFLSAVSLSVGTEEVLADQKARHRK